MNDYDNLDETLWEEAGELLDADPMAQLLIRLAELVEAIYGVDLDTWRVGEGPDEWELLNRAFDTRFDRYYNEARRRRGLPGA